MLREQQLHNARCMTRLFWAGVAWFGAIAVMVAARRARGDGELDPVEVLRRWDEGEGPPPSGISHEDTADAWQ